MQKFFKVTLKVTKKCNLETLVRYVTKYKRLYLDNKDRVLPKKIILFKVSEEKLDVLRDDSKKIGFEIKIKEYNYDKIIKNSLYGYFGEENINNLRDNSNPNSLYPTAESVNDMIFRISDQLAWKETKNSFTDLINITLPTSEESFITMDKMFGGELFIYNKEWGTKSDIEQGNLYYIDQMFDHTLFNNPYLDNKKTHVCIRGTNMDGTPASSYYTIMGGERGTIDENKLVYPINRFRFSNAEILRFIILDFVSREANKLKKNK